MLENNSELSVSKLSLVKPVPAEGLSLKEIAANDKDVLEFFRLIHEHDLREKALELLERRIGRNTNN